VEKGGCRCARRVNREDQAPQRQRSSVASVPQSLYPLASQHPSRLPLALPHQRQGFRVLNLHTLKLPSTLLVILSLYPLRGRASVSSISIPSSFPVPF